MDKHEVKAIIRDVDDCLKRAKDGVGRDLGDGANRAYAEQQMIRVVQTALRAVKALRSRGEPMEDASAAPPVETMPNREKKLPPPPKPEIPVDKPLPGIG